MRYLLYDTSKGKTQLSKEIDFIKSYFDLMKLRYPKTVQIKCITPKKIPDVEIPPMLFISFVENAFKHGISFQLKSFVHFTIKIEGEFLFCNIVNSKTSDKTKFDKDYSGIGLSNVKKNLELLYPKAYNLKIDETEDRFSVELTIPLKYNLLTIITH
jgi:LytS/YehU family sensor histidine kinase